MKNNIDKLPSNQPRYTDNIKNIRFRNKLGRYFKDTIKKESHEKNDHQ
jgi:hypothetical protein